MSTQFITEAYLPTEYADFQVHVFEHDGQEHLAMVKCTEGGELDLDQPMLTRVHSECLTGDGLFSLRCDCGPQLAFAMKAIGEAEQGLLIYLRQEGRGIGLTEKIKAYHLQDQGADTFDANVTLGHAPDNRSYAMLGDVFKHFGIKTINLMTNNPDKIAAIEEAGVTVNERIAVKVGHNPHNQAYLQTKLDKFKHL